VRWFAKPVMGSNPFEGSNPSLSAKELNNFSIMDNQNSKAVKHDMVTTAFELDNFKIVKTLGISRGIIVRSRSIFGNIGAGIQTLFGGNISLFTELCERTRADAFDLMLEHAGDIGANAVIGARYDATEIMGGVTEVLAYGTAVIVEPK